MTYMFKGILIDYQKEPHLHRIVVNGIPGPWLRKSHLCSYELEGRYFIAQCIISELPECFELIAPKEIKLSTTEPKEEMG